MEYKLMTDSCSDLPIEIVRKYDIDIVHFTIHMEGEELRDDMGVSFDREEFFNRLKNGATASTSQVNAGTYLEKFKYYADNNIPLLYLAFSSGLSGSYNSAMTALDMLKEEYDNPAITIIDTQAACLGEGLLVYEAAKRKAAGQSLPEVAEWVEENKKRVHSWVTVDDIKHLQRGGRVSAASATIGTLLSVKPIIAVTKNGKLVPVAKVRGRKKSLQYLVDKTVEGAVRSEEQTMFIGHAGVPEEAEWVKSELEKRLQVKDIIVSPFGPTIASHTGFGSMALFSLGEERTLEG
ncbi:DegV family protein [Atopococcus tabaci]|uniref:DegV family protein n=1 Tax=Atopococcus tabaci TaxID=269774 RepID=UPI000426A8FD|nr:DegV family protein [Atopococcus tabaci]